MLFQWGGQQGAGELSDCVNEFKTKGIKTLRVFNFFANNKQVKETDADIKYQNNVNYKKHKQNMFRLIYIQFISYRKTWLNMQNIKGTKPAWYKLFFHGQQGKICFKNTLTTNSVKTTASRESRYWQRIQRSSRCRCFFLPSFYSEYGELICKRKKKKNISGITSGQIQQILSLTKKQSSVSARLIRGSLQLFNLSLRSQVNKKCNLITDRLSANTKNN